MMLEVNKYDPAALFDQVTLLTDVVCSLTSTIKKLSDKIEQSAENEKIIHPEAFYLVSELAEKTGIKYSTITSKCTDGLIPYVMGGRKRNIKGQDFINWMNTRKCNSSADRFEKKRVEEKKKLKPVEGKK